MQGQTNKLPKNVGRASRESRNIIIFGLEGRNIFELARKKIDYKFELARKKN